MTLLLPGSGTTACSGPVARGAGQGSGGTAAGVVGEMWTCSSGATAWGGGSGARRSCQTARCEDGRVCGRYASSRKPEDLVEELVGEIYDEYDAGADHEDRVTKANGSVDVDGGLILQEFASASGFRLPEGHYETVAGYVLDRLGRLPRAGDQVEVDGHVLTVTAMDRLRIARIRVTPVDGQA